MNEREKRKNPENIEQLRLSKDGWLFNQKGEKVHAKPIGIGLVHKSDFGGIASVFRDIKFPKGTNAIVLGSPLDLNEGALSLVRGSYYIYPAIFFKKK